MSPISSRNSVPPDARSNRPIRRATAPVKAPRSTPNSSLSRRFSGMAAQLTATYGPFARVLCSWIRRARHSFPVPLSPVISTLAELGATRAAVINADSMPGLSPTKGATEGRRDGAAAGAHPSVERQRTISSRMASGGGGNGSTSNAPCFSESTMSVSDMLRASATTRVCLAMRGNSSCSNPESLVTSNSIKDQRCSRSRTRPSDIVETTVSSVTPGSAAYRARTSASVQTARTRMGKRCEGGARGGGTRCSRRRDLRNDSAAECDYVGRATTVQRSDSSHKRTVSPVTSTGTFVRTDSRVWPRVPATKRMGRRNLHQHLIHMFSKC